MKPKTGFESGSSPTATATVRVSANGAPIHTGRGLEETKRRIAEAFEKIRHAEPSRSQQTPPQLLVYTEQHKTRFHERAKRLTLAAITSFYITPTRGGPIEITVPTETAEELFRQTGGGE